MEHLPHEKPIREYEKTIEHFKKQNRLNPVFDAEIVKLEDKLEQLKEQVYAKLTPWQRVMICRHPARPHSSDYIHTLCDHFVELHGDRLYRDDQSIIGGIGWIQGQKFLILGQEKGKDTESRVQRNFGMLNPEGYRKALRLMRLAEKFHIPVLSFLDTPGAYPGLGAEQRGQAWAIARNLQDMALIETPIIVVIIGEASSGGAIGTAVGDCVGMLQHAYYSVISPEGCASILWKDASRREDAAAALKLNAEYLLEHDVVDEIISEPLGGAHHGPQAVFSAVESFVLKQAQALKELSVEELLQRRYMKFRKLGAYQAKLSAEEHVAE